MDSYSLGYSIGQLVGCSCCCLFAVLVIVGVAVLAFRGGKSKADGVEGAPAGPERGSKATASLTKMEASATPESSDADGATVVLTRPSQPAPPAPASAPALSIPKPVAAPPPVPKPVAAPPPVPKPAAPPPVPPAAPKPPVVPTASPTFLGGTIVDDPTTRPPRGPANFVPGRTIVVDDEDEVPMPPPPKKE